MLSSRIFSKFYLVCCLVVGANLFAQEEEADEIINSQESDISESAKIRAALYLTSAEEFYKEGEDFYHKNNLKQAIFKYDQALIDYAKLSDKNLKVKQGINKTKKRLSEVQIQYAQKLIKLYKEKRNIEDYKYVRSLLQEAQKNDPDRAKEIYLLNKKYEKYHIDAYIKGKIDPNSIIKPEEIINPGSGGLAAKKLEVDIYLQRAEIYLSKNEYSKALKEVNSARILIPADPKVAMMNKKVWKMLGEKADRGGVQSRAIAEVMWKWNYPVRENSIVLSSDTSSPDTVIIDIPDNDVDKVLELKLEPFDLEGVSINEIVQKIKEDSVTLDPKKRGISIIIQKADSSSTPAPDPVGGDNPFEEEPIGQPQTSTDIGSQKIDFSVVSASIRDVINLLCLKTGLKYKIISGGIVIYRPGTLVEETLTKYFRVGVGFIDLIQNANNDPNAAADVNSQVKSFFEDLGVTFPNGTSIRFVAGAGRLVVTNTLENINKVEKAIKELDNQNRQVTIEARFVEIGQTDLEQLSFEWELYDGRGFDVFGSNIDILSQSNRIDTGYSLSSSSRTALGISQGGVGVTPNFLVGTSWGSLGMEAAVRLVRQKNSLNVLSAPIVTALSGEPASIRVVNLRFLPNSWTDPQINDDGDTFRFTPPVPQFDNNPTELGVVMRVTPEIDPDSNSVRLNVEPEVTEFLGYDDSFDYQVTVGEENVVDPDGNVRQVPRVLDVPLRMPILSSRQVITSVLVWDGETITLGGLIREKAVDQDDGIPYLEDIPLIGSFFKQTGSFSEKSNLTIFIRVRLIDPAGVPIRPVDIAGLPDFDSI